MDQQEEKQTATPTWLLFAAQKGRAIQREAERLERRGREGGMS